ncbi:MAG TPA: hypothetical protein HA302_08250 [Thermococcaceae archaeon]|nr:hypothetical protein [Thermococcaceae archaeon]
MERETVVSDSTFYIAFLTEEEINDPQALITFLKSYRFIMGHVIRNEIRKRHAKLVDELGIENLVEIEDSYDYAALLSPIGDRIFQKGEYESMAIAFIKLYEGVLHSLVIDDNKARKWLEKNLPQLSNYLNYSTRFIVNSCIVDRKVSKGDVLKILQRIKRSIERGARPFNLTWKQLDKIENLIKEVEEFGKD